MAENASSSVVEPKQDGRRASRDRNRLAVVDALLDFYAEGNLRPGAQAVAERSGVSRRSVFRYFEDLDDLDKTAMDRQQERVRHLIDIPGMGEGPLAGRIDAMAAQRARLFAALGAAGRVARVRAPFQAVIERELTANRRAFGRQVQAQFAPELEQLDDKKRTALWAAADVICSFEAYDLFQVTRAWGEREFEAYVREALAALFAGVAK